MKRLVPALALLSLTGCTYLGLSSEEKTAVAPPAAEQAAAVQPSPQPTLAVAEGWATPTTKSAKAAAGFFTVANTGTGGDRLVSASSPRAKSIEIHEMAMEGTKLKMRPAQGLDVPAGATLALNDKGNHLMFMGLDKPFKDGETVPVKLVFEKSGEVETTLTVKKPGS